MNLERGDRSSDQVSGVPGETGENSSVAFVAVKGWKAGMSVEGKGFSIIEGFGFGQLKLQMTALKDHEGLRPLLCWCRELLRARMDHV